MKLILWFKTLQAVVAAHTENARLLREIEMAQKRLQPRIVALEEIIRQHTVIGVDVGFRGPSTVIVMGRYKNHDHVECFTIGETDFHSLIGSLKHMQQMGRLEVIDAPHAIRVNILHELQR